MFVRLEDEVEVNIYIHGEVWENEEQGRGEESNTSGENFEDTDSEYEYKMSDETEEKNIENEEDDEGTEVSQKEQNENTILEEDRVDDTDIEWYGDENIVCSGDELPSDKESDGEGKLTLFLFLILHSECTFQIRDYVPNHTCNITFHVKNMKSTWLSKKYMHIFKTDPKRGIKGFRVDAIEEIRCNITRNQAARAIRLALLMLEGSASEQYALLWDYADEIKRSNPGSIVILGTEQEGGQNMFDRFYVCLQALKLNFLNVCRPVICVDGCHLKGSYGGVLLSAISIDPNNNFFPICYAMVMKENKDTWDWFLTLLKMDCRIEECGPMTFMSDKQKRLVGALQELFPNVEHRFCVRHLHSNFKNYGFRGLAFKNILWKAARATTVNEFTRRMQEMKELDECAFAWFNDKNPKEWSRSHFSSYPRREHRNYTHQCYRVEKYLKVYEHPILPINGRKEWKKSDFVPLVPPNPMKKVGRPRKTRRLEPDEPVQKKKERKPAPIFKEGSNKIKRQQTTVKCGKCGVQGHNARTCQGPVIDVVTDAASQVMGRNEPVAEAPNEAVAESHRNYPTET
ncbi:hypothetical protein Sango_2834600 [Sesamum angolense]|uniref:CCHC-type domain-containing protein n=1 Tax=Sesamum angolense TaxID=2727404 RepID=A0AAE1VZM5_9LAMI|nr:hypothetical protein Sango_2834600 [Sesamum angolense]